MITTIGYPQALVALAPTAEFSMTNVLDYGTLAWYSPEIPIPTQAECDAEIVVLQAQEPLNLCKEQASKLLYETDWTTIPDVANSAVSNPYLLNPSDFAAYRSQLRQLAVYPVADPVWPIKPATQWSA
jgi:hypothetical protein